SPVILWNADHQWVSFVKQLGRARIEDFTLRYIGELIPTQIAFATPLVFILGMMGLYAFGRRKAGASAARVLLSAMFWTITLYFGTTSWLSFYLPAGSCVAQRGQRFRWVNMPDPDPALLKGRLLYVDEARQDQPLLKKDFARVEKVAELKRMRGPLLIETIEL